MSACPLTFFSDSLDRPPVTCPEVLLAMPGVTATLASHVWAHSGCALAPEVERAVRVSMADAIGCAFAGSATAHATAAYRASRTSGLNGNATVVGQQEQLPAADAAFVNTMSARAHLFDDTYGPGHMHVGAALAFAGLSLGEVQDAPLSQVWSAVALGAEVACRIALAAGEAHYLRGFHNSGTCGVFGVAVAAACLDKLSEPEIRRSLSLAGEYASGLRQFQVDGHPAISALHAANAARNGIISASLAREGFPSADEILAGQKGFLTCFGAEDDANSLLLDGLGTHWMATELSVKPFAGSRCTHGAATAMDDLRREFSLAERDVVAIRAYVPSFNFENIDRVRPETMLDAQLSLQYALAHVLAYGHLSPRDFTPGKLSDPSVTRLQDRIVVSVNPALAGTAARVEVELRDGRSIARTVAESRGDPGSPFTMDQLRDKFSDNASTCLAGHDADGLFDLVMFGSGDMPVREVTAAFAALRPEGKSAND